MQHGGMQPLMLGVLDFVDLMSANKNYTNSLVLIVKIVSYLSKSRDVVGDKFMDFLLYSKMILGQTDAKGLSQFFYDSWKDTPDRIYKYRVYITRRAFKLNKLF